MTSIYCEFLCSAHTSFPFHSLGWRWEKGKMCFHRRGRFKANVTNWKFICEFCSFCRRKTFKIWIFFCLTKTFGLPQISFQTYQWNLLKAFLFFHSIQKVHGHQHTFFFFSFPLKAYEWLLSWVELFNNLQNLHCVKTQTISLLIKNSGMMSLVANISLLKDAKIT